MGFFKTIGTKLKRFASIKNVIKGVTGDFNGILDDAKRVMTTSMSPNEMALGGIPEVSPEFVAALDNAGQDFSNNIKRQVAGSAIAQKNIDGTTKFILSVWWKTTWEAHKNLILGVGAISLFLVVYFGFFKRKLNRRR